MNNARIISSGMAVPDRVLSNAHFDAELGVDVSTWLEESAQIFNRRWLEPGGSTSSLALAAAGQCLERAGVAPSQLDLIILTTDTPDYWSPATASVVQHELGADRAGAFDVNAACAGFVSGLDMAAKYIRADEHYQYILVIGAYAMSRHLNPADKKTVTLFADGAGAVLLRAEANSQVGYQSGQLISKGQYWDYMGIYGGGTVAPIGAEAPSDTAHKLVFAKKFPPELNPEMWSGMVRELCRRLEVTPEAVDHYFFTQININAILATLDLLNLPPERAHNVMHQYGYTGSACIPMAFHEAWELGKVREGDLIFFISSGGGLAFASAAFVL